MLLKTEDKKDLELSFRPVADPTEIINEKTDKKDIIITIFLYVMGTLGKDLDITSPPL